MPGQLFIVATPIGNMEDLTFRALRVLREVRVIACEDTRVSQKLLQHYQVETPMVSLHAYSRPEAIQALVERLKAGDDVALISDAGTPLVSDPGEPLLAAAIAERIAIVPIPGPSALLSALVGAGLPVSRFVFLGFLPRDDAARREILAAYRAHPIALVIYEAPTRLGDTLEALERSLGDRRACVARELTKRFETFDRAPLSELRGRYHVEATRGEVVVVVAPPESSAPEVEEGLDRRVESEIARALESGLAPAEIARLIAGAFGLTKKEAYRRVLARQKG